MTGLNWAPAAVLAERLARREFSAVELMNACYDQIEGLNPQLNAIVNLLPRTAALQLAEAADRDAAQGRIRGPLHGLPMAPKDTHDAVGFPTTFGFRPWAARQAKADGLVVARQRAAGALFIGKTNTPEFALGSHTFNSLFGLTRNPWNPDRTAGGSSGGAAVALATGMLPLADGSDMGGSLRNPASYCNVVGLRPSLGRVPDDRPMGWLARLSTAGPMARSVADAALLLSVQAGPHRDDPLSLADDGASFGDSLACRPEGLRIAWCTDLPGAPVAATVASVIAAAAATFARMGCDVEQDAPDLADAMEVFQVQRAAALGLTAAALDAELPDWRRHAKDTAVWNMDAARRLTADQLIGAEVKRTALYRTAARFFERYDALLLPAAQVPPFPVEQEWVREIDGVQMQTYIDWMTVCCVVSVLGLPAISVPGGFTPDGLPVGVQIVGPPRGDLAVLRIAHLFEQATRFGERRPPLASAPGTPPGSDAATEGRTP